MMRSWVINGRRVNGLMKRVQSGVTVLTAGNVSVTQTINAVDLPNAFPTFIGFISADGSANFGNCTCRLAITNATTLTISGSGAYAADQQLSWSVCEPWPGVVKNIQRGSANTNVTLGMFNTNRVMVFWTGIEQTGSAGLNSTMLFYVFNNTTLLASTYSGGGQVYGYVLVELN